MKIAPIVVDRDSQGPGPLHQKQYQTLLLLLITFAVLLYSWFSYQLLRLPEIPIGPDAWSMIEVARSIQNGTFPRIETVRQFKIIDYIFSNTAFPPLTPLLLSLHGSEGAWASAIVHQSSLIALALPAPIFFALRKKFNPAEAIGVALLTTIVALSYAPYWEDVVINGSMSLSVFLLGSAFSVLLSGRIGTREAALIGFLMGLNCLNRMDGLPLAGVMLLGVLCVSGFRSAPPLTYFGAVLITMCPWIIFSKIYFGVFLISDNAAVALAVSDHILRIHGAPAENLTVLMKAKIRNLNHFLVNFAREAIRTTSLLILAVATTWPLTSASRSRLLCDPKLWIILVAAASLIGPTATGYEWATRYASPLVLAMALAGFTGLAECAHRFGYERHIARCAQFACLAFVGLTLIKVTIEPWRSEFGQRSADETRRALRSLQQSEMLFSQLENHPRVFFAINRSGPAAEYFEIFRIGALGRIHAIPQPYDWGELSPDEQMSLFETLSVDFVAGACPVGQTPTFVMSLSGYQGCLYSLNDWLNRFRKSNSG